MATYSEKLKDPQWQKKRLEVFIRDNFTCRCCGEKPNSLYIYSFIVPEDDPWNTIDDALISVCEDCYKICYYDNFTELENELISAVQFTSINPYAKQIRLIVRDILLYHIKKRISNG